MYLDVIANDDRSDKDREQLQRLNAAVYPPGDSTDNPGAGLSWARTERSVVVRITVDGDIVAHAGVLTRRCLHNDRPVRIGGIGGVKTHPEIRNSGLGRQVMTRAAEILRDDLAADFGLLVCPVSAAGFYERLGWRAFSGELWIDQPAGRTLFTINQVKVLPLRGEAPVSGTIDLCGFPW